MPHHTSPRKKYRVALLLCNLGTPEAHTTSAVRIYLKEFLQDRRVIEIPQFFWRIVLYLLILPLRSCKTAKKYASIWLGNESPLRYHAQKQVIALQKNLDLHKISAQSFMVMRYGTPSIEQTISEINKHGVEKILFLPMYPQYAASTTASACDILFQSLTNTKIRNQPAVRTVKSFHDHPAYIAALFSQIKNFWQTERGRPNFTNGDKLLLSFHGLPYKRIAQGDPYYAQCKITAQLLREALGLTENEVILTFQSRFGFAKWLQPYTAEILKQLGKIKTARVDIFCPGFVVDCLETLEEIAIYGRKIFMQSGGQSYHAIPCLNQSKEWIEALTTIVKEHLI